MNKIVAQSRDLLSVLYLVYINIKEHYPEFYPPGAVEFLLKADDRSRILHDIEDGRVLLFMEDNIYIATATIKDNEICRLYLLPDYQGKGYGSQIMDNLEDTILKKHSKVRLNASLPSQAFFRRRGYREYYFDRIKTENGDYMCYCTMVLKNKTILIE